MKSENIENILYLEESMELVGEDVFFRYREQQLLEAGVGEQLHQNFFNGAFFWKRKQ